MPRMNLSEDGHIKNAGYIEIKNQSESTADLFFYGDIVSESWQSEWFEDDMCPKDVVKFLDQLDGVETINVHYNSGGGNVFAGIAISNQLKQYNAQIVSWIDGVAASTAGFMALNADKVICPRDILFMMHKPSIYCSGNADDLQKSIALLDQCQKIITDIYLSKAKEGTDEAKITAMINETTWLTGEQMADYFDIELEDSLGVAACDSDYFDKYKNLPEPLNRKKQAKLEINVDTVADRVCEKILNRLSAAIDQPTKLSDLEKEKNDILCDLDYI